METSVESTIARSRVGVEVEVSDWNERGVCFGAASGIGGVDWEYTEARVGGTALVGMGGGISGAGGFVPEGSSVSADGSL